MEFCTVSLVVLRNFGYKKLSTLALRVNLDVTSKGIFSFTLFLTQTANNTLYKILFNLFINKFRGNRNKFHTILLVALGNFGHKILPTLALGVNFDVISMGILSLTLLVTHMANDNLYRILVNFLRFLGNSFECCTILLVVLGNFGHKKLAAFALWVNFDVTIKGILSLTLLVTNVANGSLNRTLINSMNDKFIFNLCLILTTDRLHVLEKFEPNPCI